MEHLQPNLKYPVELFGTVVNYITLRLKTVDKIMTVQTHLYTEDKLKNICVFI